MATGKQTGLSDRPYFNDIYQKISTKNFSLKLQSRKESHIKALLS